MLVADLLTGLAIAAVVIPQGIGKNLNFSHLHANNHLFAAYSSLAQVPPVYGLYTAWVCCVQ